MTAINIFRKTNRISILTDGAGYDPSGVLQARVNKCVPIPHLSAAVACRGPSTAAASFAAYAAFFATSFDDLIDKAELLALKWEDEFHAQLLGQDIQIFIAGWSERTGRPESYVINTGNLQPGMDAGVIYPLEPATVAPIPSDDDLAAVNWPSSLDADTFRPERDGVLLLEAQRNMRMPVSADDPEGPEGHLVGSHICLTEITKEGATQRIIHRWGDQLGELIIPTKVSAPAPMSRQQRRALERSARRA